MKRRYYLWVVLLAIVLGLAWGKARRNRLEAEEQAAWHERIERLDNESWRRYDELLNWANSLSQAANPKQEIAEKLNGGQPIAIKQDGDLEVVKWQDPELGFQIDFAFSREKLVSRGGKRNDAMLMAANPPPPQYARDGKAERFRRGFLPWGIGLWFVALAGAIVSRRYGQIAAEGMVVISVACAAAWLVAPLYNLTGQGIFSNDPLFFALLMYVASLVMLGFRLARSDELPRRIQFGLRTLLIVITLFAVLMAMGPLGYVAIAAINGGAVLLLFVVRMFKRSIP